MNTPRNFDQSDSTTPVLSAEMQEEERAREALEVQKLAEYEQKLAAKRAEKERAKAEKLKEGERAREILEVQKLAEYEQKLAAKRAEKERAKEEKLQEEERAREALEVQKMAEFEEKLMAKRAEKARQKAMEEKREEEKAKKYVCWHLAIVILFPSCHFPTGQDSKIVK